MSRIEDDFFFELDPDEEEDIPSNVPREILPSEPKSKRTPPENISDRLKKNPTGSEISRQKLEQLYNRVSEHLSPEQRRYTRKVINGTIGVDPMLEMEILVRQLSLIFINVSMKMFDEDRVTRDYASFTDSYRQSIKDLNDFIRQAKEDEGQEKNVNALTVAERQKEVSKLDKLLQVHGSD